MHWLNNMKTLNEQDGDDFDFDAALAKEPDVKKIKVNTGGNKDTKVIKPKDPTKVKDTTIVKDPVVVQDPNKSPELIAAERRLSNPTKLAEITKLMINGINYLRYLHGKLDVNDIDEYGVMDYMMKHLRSHDGIAGTEFARYCDVIYRFSNPSKYASLHSLIKKYPKQYNYFISRNGGTSVTFDWLQSKNYKKFTFYTPFVGDPYAEWLDWEDKDSDMEIEKRISKLARSFSEFNPPKKVAVVKRLSDIQINNMVLACYNVKAYGAPQEWLRIKK